MDVMPVAEFHAKLKGQEVSGREHVAVLCPICAAPQSIASLIRAGASPENAEKMIGFSCEGRLTGAGPWPSEKDRSAKAKRRRTQRGCDWILGGLFKIHTLEVEMEDGKRHPTFQVATPEQAQELEKATRA